MPQFFKTSRPIDRRLMTLFLIAAFVFSPLVSAKAGEKSTLPVGIANSAPSEGPFVELPGGQFMVPYTQKIPGTDIEFEMIPIPGGAFTMGTPETADAFVDDEGPTVSLSVKPMWVAKTETRWDMHDEYMRMYT